jgi:hypothetical protein
MKMPPLRKPGTLRAIDALYIEAAPDDEQRQQRIRDVNERLALELYFNTTDLQCIESMLRDE